MEGQVQSEEIQAPEEQRGRSSVDFPYFDLESGVEIGKAIAELGGISCDSASLAAKLSMAPDGGGFRTRLLAAKIFNIISYGRGNAGQIDLTEIGRSIADPLTERKGKFEAFMSIALYRTLFEQLKGSLLPPPPAIERMMESMGVAPKQKDRARQVFLRSAKQAGLLELASDRLTPPPNLTSPPSAQATAPAPPPSKGGGSGDGGEPPMTGRLRFEVPIPGKPSATVIVPDDLDADDWEMLSSMMTTYINRWKKFQK